MSGDQDRRCVCKGWITADPKDPAPGVDAHNDTGRHLAWRYAAIARGELVIPETPAEQLRRHLGVPTPTVVQVERDPDSDDERIPSGTQLRPNGWGLR